MYFSFYLSCTFLFALMQKEKIPKEKNQGCLSGAAPADFRPEGQKTRCAQTNCPSLRSEADLRLTPRRGGRGLRGDYTGVGALGFTGSARRQGRGLRGAYTCAGAVGFTGSARRGGRGLRGDYACAGAVWFTGSARRVGRGLRGGYTCVGALGFTGSSRRGGRGLRGGYTCAGALGFTGATRPAWQCVSPGEVPHPRHRSRFLWPCGSWRGRRSICRLPPRRRSQSAVR